MLFGNIIWNKANWALSLGFSFLTYGCSSWGDVPENFQIETGNEPHNQNEMVRFRTTYYFRIVDSCDINPVPEKGKYVPESSSGEKNDSSKAYVQAMGVFMVRNSGKLKIVNDSLYRFRMTGKGSALFSNIHFESGVLRADQIDPFGTNIKYDKETGAYRVQPGSRVREQSRRNDIIQEIERINVLKGKLVAKHQNELNDLISGQIELLRIENDSGSMAEGENKLCPDGRPITKSYYLYGPEGVRKLDPDERLLMALTVDSKPLIGMLQQFSGRHLKAQQTKNESFRYIVVERGKISDSLNKFSVIEAKEKATIKDISSLLTELKTQFKEN